MTIKQIKSNLNLKLNEAHPKNKPTYKSEQIQLIHSTDIGSIKLNDSCTVAKVNIKHGDTLKMLMTNEVQQAVGDVEINEPDDTLASSRLSEVEEELDSIKVTCVSAFQFKQKLCDLFVMRSDTIAEVKQLIAKEIAVPANQLAIIYKDDQMIRRRAENHESV